MQEVDGVRRVWNRADDRSNGRFERECDVRRLHVLDLLDTESGRFAEEVRESSQSSPQQTYVHCGFTARMSLWKTERRERRSFSLSAT